MSIQDIENTSMQTAWDIVAPNIAQDDAITKAQGYNTVQENTEELYSVPKTADIEDTPVTKNSLSQIYSKAAKRQGMDFQEYCKYIRCLNREQRHIVTYNRAWCKKYIDATRHNRKIIGYRVFLSGPGGVGKTHVVCLIQRDMSYLLGPVIKPDPDQPIVLVTAPTGSAAYQIGGSTIHSAFLLYDNFKKKPSWEKRSIMQLKLEHMMLSLTDEVSMVGFEPFQKMNQTVCEIKGTADGNWGDICVLAVGDLYQLPPIAQCPVYLQPPNIHTLNDFAPNGWEKMCLHELTQPMRQKDPAFAHCLNRIRTCT